MASQITVSGKNGAGITVTSLLISNISSFSVDLNTYILTVVVDSVTQMYDIAGKSTFTVSVSSGNYTITVA